MTNTRHFIITLTTAIAVGIIAALAVALFLSNFQPTKCAPKDVAWVLAKNERYCK